MFSTMTSEEISLLGDPIPRSNFGAAPQAIFLKNDIYYKFWGNWSNAYYVVNGLDVNFQGCSTISALSVGLLTNYTSGALKSLIRNEDGLCIGYSSFAGNTITTAHKLYDEFIDNLVDHSIKCKYAFVDTHVGNIIERNGKLSLIDVDFAPVSLDHDKKFTELEYQVWTQMIHTGKDTDYFNRLKERYLDLGYKPK